MRLSGNPVSPADYLGIVPNIPITLSEELLYKEINKAELVKLLNARNSMLAGEPYNSAIITASKEFNINPLLMFAITGQEQSFVPKGKPNSEQIANNPFNVYHSWYEYNTNVTDSARIAARTIIRLSKDRPEGVDPILWLNTRGGAGGYAGDRNWFIGVSRIFRMLKNDVGYNIK